MASTPAHFQTLALNERLRLWFPAHEPREQDPHYKLFHQAKARMKRQDVPCWRCGVRYADLRGYTYDRDDVTARGLANVYAQTLGTIFSSVGEKPYEVELIVAEVGERPEDDQIYRLPHDGSIVDEHGAVAVGGNSDQIGSYLDQQHRDGMSLGEALKLAMASLARDGNGGSRQLTAEQLEVAVLDRTRPQQRKFRRVLGRQLTRLLESEGEAAPADDGDSEEE